MEEQHKEVTAKTASSTLKGRMLPEFLQGHIRRGKGEEMQGKDPKSSKTNKQNQSQHQL